MSNLFSGESLDSTAFGVVTKNHTAAEVERRIDVTLPVPESEKGAYNWSDKEFFDRFLKPILDSKFSAPTLEQRQGFACVFLEWYIHGGTTHTENHITSVIAYLLMSVQYEKDDQLVYTAAPFFGEEKPLTSYPSVMVPGFNPSWINYTTRAVGKKSFTLNTVKEFYEELYAMIKQEKPIDAMRGVNMAAYLAASVLRMLTKDPEDVEEHIATKATRQCVGFFGWDEKKAVPPPHAKCYTLSPILENRQKATREILTVLVMQELNETVPMQLKRVFNAACMLVFSELGLGPLKWLEAAAKSTKRSTGYIIACSMVNPFRTEAEKISAMTATVEHSKTWRHARLLDPDVLLELNTKASPAVSLLWALLANEQERWESLLTTSPSLKGFSGYKEAAETWAKIILASIGQLDTSSVEKGTIAEKLVKRQMKMKKQQAAGTSSAGTTPEEEEEDEDIGIIAPAALENRAKNNKPADNQSTSTGGITKSGADKEKEKPNEEHKYPDTYNPSTLSPEETTRQKDMTSEEWDKRWEGEPDAHFRARITIGQPM